MYVKWNISSPVPTSCSYFRQLEILNETGVDSFHPNSDYVLREGNFQLSDNMRPNLAYNVSVQNHPAISAPFPLRQKLESAMVDSWDEGLGDFEKVYRRYYDKCQPQECYYEKIQEKTHTFYFNHFVLVFGGLATIMMAAVHGGINGITSVGVKVLKKISPVVSGGSVGDFVSCAHSRFSLPFASTDGRTYRQLRSAGYLPAAAANCPLLGHQARHWLARQDRAHRRRGGHGKAGATCEESERGPRDALLTKQRARRGGGVATVRAGPMYPGTRVWVWGYVVIYSTRK